MSMTKRQEAWSGAIVWTGLFRQVLTLWTALHEARQTALATEVFEAGAALATISLFPDQAPPQEEGQEPLTPELVHDRYIDAVRRASATLKSSGTPYGAEVDRIAREVSPEEE
jgi:hypothetical protein